MPQASKYLRRPVALPGEHGAWAFLLAPLLIGLFAGGRFGVLTIYLVVASLCAFLVRQPITVAVKVHTGRRSRDLLPAARLWVAVYGGVGLLHVAGLVLRGFGYILWLAVPGLPVFAWHLALIARREERRQWLIEVVGAGVLALIAPAGLWIGVGHPDPLGWWLWVLCWAQSVSWIAYAYLRLTQRAWTGPRPSAGGRWRAGLPALSAALIPLAGAAALGAAALVPATLWPAFLVQALETLTGTVRPAVGAKPRAIGFRQLAVSMVQTTLFILLW